MIVDYFMFATFLILSVLSIYFDCKENRIPNKMIILFLIITVVLQSFYLANVSRYYFGLFVFCVVESFVISFGFYKMKIWAGGDTKLFVLMSMLVPGVVYKNGGYESIIAIIIIVYSFSFVFIVFESIYLNLKQKDVLIEKKNAKRNYLGLFFDWLFCFSTIGLIQNCLIIFLNDFYFRFSVLIMFFKVIIILAVGNGYSRVSYTIKSIIILLHVVSICICLDRNIFFRFGLKNIALVTIVFFIRLWVSRYNYQKINVEDLKKGMILSAGTVVGFINSNVKGLPMNINEDMSARLNDKEINSILKWSKTNKGRKEIVIVRRIPFAVFISLGFIVYILGMILWSSI